MLTISKFEIINLLLCIAFTAIHIAVLIIMPIYFTHITILWLCSLHLLAALSYTYFSLIHEAIHRHLFKNKFANDLWARTLSIFFASPYRFLSYAHILHHRYNRLLGRPDVRFSDQNWLTANLQFYFELTVGLYIQEIMICLFIWLPKSTLHRLAHGKNNQTNYFSYLVKGLVKSHILNEIRMDALLIMLLWSMVTWLYINNIFLLISFILLRALTISALDNVFHYGTNITDVMFGKNLYLNKALRILFLNFNLHGIHHIKPWLAWQKLKQEFDENHGVYHGNFLKTALKQFSGCVIFDKADRQELQKSLTNTNANEIEKVYFQLESIGEQPYV